MRCLTAALPAVLSALFMLTGCAVGPDYKRADVETPAAFKEAEGWKQAEPRDDAQRGNWWELYGDQQLSALVQQVAISNQNVLALEAQFGHLHMDQFAARDLRLHRDHGQ